MKKWLCTFLAFSFCLFISQFADAYEKEIGSISDLLSRSISKSNKKNIAVVDFSDLQGNATELGRFVAEEISTNLSSAGKGFEIVDRTHLKSLFAEHKLTLSGVVDQSTIKRVGKIAGVDAIITGTLTPFGDSVRLSCKIISTDTARVVGAAKGDIARTKAVEDLLSKGIGGTPIVKTQLRQTDSRLFKKIGELQIRVRKLNVLKDKVQVAFEVKNDGNHEVRVGGAEDSKDPFILSDDNGTTYHYDYMWCAKVADCIAQRGTTVSAHSTNDWIVNFKREPRILAGSKYTLSAKIVYLKVSNSGLIDSESRHNVYFDELKK